MRARLRLSEVENTSKEGGGSVYEESRAAKKAGRIYKGGEGGGMKNRRNRHFSALLALHFIEGLQLSLYTWHLSDISPQRPSSRIQLLGLGLSSHHCLPLKSTQNLCSSLHFPIHGHLHLLSSSHKYSINLAYSVWNDICILLRGLI